MNRPTTSAEERYAALVQSILSTSDATFDPSGKGFGASSLKTRGKIFAMLVKDRLVVKLPRQRIEALVAAGAGERFDPGHGRVMKEWLVLGPAIDDDWLPLAQEAMDFAPKNRRTDRTV